MKNPFIISMLFSFFLFATVQAQLNPPPPTPPNTQAKVAPPAMAPPIGPTTIVSFDNDEFDFGQISQGEKVQHIFRFTNTGDQPMVISNAKGSCGCTVPEWPKEPIAPGGIGAIVVEFNSKGKIGRQAKTITITSNTNPPQTLLRLKGEIYKDDESGVKKSFELKEQIKVLDTKKEVHKMSLYPNPTKGELNLKIEDAVGQSANIEIFDAIGQLAKQIEVGDVGNGLVNLDVQRFGNGQYWLSVKVGDKERVSLPFVVAQ